MRFSLLAPYLLLAGIAGAQPETTMTVSGRVVNTATKAGVAKALVTLSVMGPRQQSTPPLEQFTSFDGSYEFTGLPQGNYIISAQRPHYSNLTFRPENILKPGDHRNFDLPLTPLSQMQVTVKDLKGKPIPQARVEVLRIQPENGFLIEKRVNTSSTDDRGLIRFYDWNAGRYLVRVAGRHGETQVNTRENASLGDTYLALEPAHLLVDLEPGRELQVPFSVALQSANTVTGSLIGLVSNAAVELEAVDAQGVAVAVKAHVDPVRGRFRIEGLPQGDWLLRAVQVAQQERREGIARIQIKGRDLNDVELRMAPVQALPVHIECPGQSAPPGMRLVDSPCNVSVTLASQRLRVSTPLVGLLTGQKVGLGQSGEYRVVVQSLDDRRYPASVTFAGKPVDASKPISVDATQPIPPLEIEMREGAATLLLTYGTTARNAARQLLLVPDSASTEGVRMMFRGQGGFSGLPPGSYSLYELAEESLAYQDRTALAKLRPLRTLRLAPGEKLTLNLDQEP